MSEEQASSAPNMDDLKERLEALLIVLNNQQPYSGPWMMAYDRAARHVQEFWNMAPQSKVVPMPKKTAPTSEASDTSRCPFCGTDPMVVMVRSFPVPPLPARTEKFLLMFACGNKQCRMAISAQMVPAREWATGSGSGLIS